MPRYFIDTDDGDVRINDDQGFDLADAEAARREAMAVLPDMARDKLPDGDRRTFVATVRDEEGSVVYSATLTLVGLSFPKSAPSGAAPLEPSRWKPGS